MMPAVDIKEHNQLAVEQFIRQLAETGRAAAAFGEAARWGRLDLLKELLAGGLAVDSRDEHGTTALMLAASGGQVKAVKYLLEQNPDVNAVAAGSGMTPLISCLAARHQKRVYLSICKLLLDAGATSSLAIRDKSGRTALDWASDGRPAEVVSLIENYGRPKP
jgi:ankyrin repeat protein